MGLWHPHYWLSWLLYGLMWCIARCPHTVRQSLGKSFGRVAYRIGGRRRRVVEVNLSQCFPSLSDHERQTLVKDVFISGGMSMVEIATSWLGDIDRISSRVRYVGLDHLLSAIDEGKGVILLGLHMATLDIAGAFLSRRIPKLEVMYRANDNPVIEAAMYSGRDRHFQKTIRRDDIRALIRSLKSGQVVWYGPDQDYGARNAVFVPFFDVPAATMTAVSRISQMTDCLVVPFTHFRIDDGQTYELHFRAPLTGFPSGSFEADARTINTLVEEAVQQRPEQYWWFHRRFKTRPEGDKPLY
mgnify:FL=1